MATIWTPGPQTAGTERDYPAGTTWLVINTLKDGQAPPRVGSANYKLKPVADPKDVLIAALLKQLSTAFPLELAADVPLIFERTGTLEAGTLKQLVKVDYDKFRALVLKVLKEGGIHV